MPELNIDTILSCNSIKVEQVEVPEWGGYVYVKTMTGQEKDDYETSFRKKENGKFVPDLENIRAKLLVMTMCDESGICIANMSHVAALSNQSSVALDRVVSAAQRINAMSDKEMDEIEKNLEIGQSEDSSLG